MAHPLHLLLIAFLKAVHPQAAVMPDTQAIVEGIEEAVAEEAKPVYGSTQADALVLSYTAWAESNMTLHAVGDHKTAFGAFQLHSPLGKGSAVTQARGALAWMRWAKGRCPRMPMQAFMSGGCYHAHDLAHYRMEKIMAAIRKMEAAERSAKLREAKRTASLQKE